MSAHTPGPWIACINVAAPGGHGAPFGSFTIHGGKPDKFGAQPAFVSVHNDLVPEYEKINAACEANARLIAAAPEMIAALQYVLEVIRSDGDIRQAEQAAAAALAKAGL